jgi:hypothetical protein
MNFLGNVILLIVGGNETTGCADRPREIPCRRSPAGLSLRSAGKRWRARNPVWPVTEIRFKSGVVISVHADPLGTCPHPDRLHLR